MKSVDGWLHNFRCSRIYQEARGAHRAAFLLSPSLFGRRIVSAAINPHHAPLIKPLLFVHAPLAIARVSLRKCAKPSRPTRRADGRAEIGAKYSSGPERRKAVWELFRRIAIGKGAKKN